LHVSGYGVKAIGVIISIICNFNERFSSKHPLILLQASLMSSRHQMFGFIGFVKDITSGK